MSVVRSITITMTGSKIVKIGQKLTSSVSLAAETLIQGHVIAVPTDTIYGISCLVQHSSAVDRLYSIKGRDASKPIAICVAEVEDIYRWAEVSVSRAVIEELLPGQVTLVFTRSDELNTNFNPDTNLIGVRIPDYPFLREVCRLAGSPLALTSANLSNTQSSLSVDEFSSLHPSLQLVFDGGQLSASEEARLGSTVLDLSQAGNYHIIRAGSASNIVQRVMQKYGISPR